jgi:hypothetical protein
MQGKSGSYFSNSKEVSMVAKRIGWSLFLVALLFSLPGSTVQARGQELASGVTPEEARSRGCSQATLKGMYELWEQGTTVGQIPGFPPPPFPNVTSGTATYDGPGNFFGTFVTSLDGAIAKGTYTGTYTAYPDCTYSDEFTTPLLPGVALHDAGTITRDGIFREVHYIRTDAGGVILGTIKKSALWPCSLKTLSGTYAVFSQGTITGQFPGFPPPPLLWAHSGIVTFDGEGGLSYSEMATLNGTSYPDSGTGTYSVNPDCTVSFVVNAPGLVPNPSIRQRPG